MARKEEANKDERINERMKDMEEYLSQLPAHERILMSDLIREYFWYSESAKDERDAIDSEGSVIQQSNGMKINPHVDVAHKYSSRISTRFTELMKVFKNSLNSKDDEDELIAFLRNS